MKTLKVHLPLEAVLKNIDPFNNEDARERHARLLGLRAVQLR